MSEPVEIVSITPADLVAQVRGDAEQLAASLIAASDAGIGPAILLPELVKVFKASGLTIPGGF